MKYYSVLSIAGIGICTLALAGCASKPASMADVMRQHATEEQAQVHIKSELAEEWEMGSKLVASGEDHVSEGEELVESAERDLAAGQEDIALGRREIAEGQRLINESERKFSENFPELRLDLDRLID